MLTILTLSVFSSLTLGINIVKLKMRNHRYCKNRYLWQCLETTVVLLISYILSVFIAKQQKQHPILKKPVIQVWG